MEKEMRRRRRLLPPLRASALIVVHRLHSGLTGTAQPPGIKWSGCLKA